VFSEEEARKMIEIADYKQNGVIEFDEFVELMSSESKVRLLAYVSIPSAYVRIHQHSTNSWSS
jgi:predicted amidohydrolase